MQDASENKTEEVKESFTWEFDEEKEKERPKDFVEIINKNYYDNQESEIKQFLTIYF